MNYLKIYEYLDVKKTTMNQLAKAVGLSHTGLTKALGVKSLRVETLERIANFFEVSIGTFFYSEEQSQYPKFEYEVHTLRSINVTPVEQQLKGLDLKGWQLISCIEHVFVDDELILLRALFKRRIENELDYKTNNVVNK
ncbi:MAG: helix-turn-helix transcriptional regulator [Bacteroidales bacterium]|nr:helix-turn-helix transcriptional regulator [Bacteroidales bacterium]